jgi:hypothetical protein
MVVYLLISGSSLGICAKTPVCWAMLFSLYVPEMQGEITNLMVTDTVGFEEVSLRGLRQGLGAEASAAVHVGWAK